MTGFGSSLCEEDGRSVEVELRSVNHRYLKVVLKLPGSLSAREAEIENSIRACIRRGTVTARIRYQDAQQPPRFRVDVEAVKDYRESVGALEAEFGEAAPSDGRRLPLVLGLPGVVREREDAEKVDDSAWGMVREALDQALSELVSAREREGTHLQGVLSSQGATVAALLAQARERASHVLPEQRDRLLQRVRRVLQEVDPTVALSDADLLREVCLLSDRSDVTEELDRMTGHLEAIDAILNADDEVGRKLDFMLQEVNREINTIGSKANDTELAHLVVDIKCEIERMREQVQNLE